VIQEISASPNDSRSRRFEAIFRTTHSRVLAYALRRSADPATAEDVVSETFLVAWRRLDIVPNDPLPWLLGTARKVLANQRRSASRREAAVGPLVNLATVEPADPATPTEERIADDQAFAEAFARLGAEDQEVLLLIAWDGLAPREAAKVLGCSAATFSVRLYRARRRLLKELEARGHSINERNYPAR
jgi:RNA polymerase sigma-70 factor (ECF subfamily)